MDMLVTIGCILFSLFGLMLLLYASMCFVTWISDIIETKSWRHWK